MNEIESLEEKLRSLTPPVPPEPTALLADAADSPVRRTPLGETMAGVLALLGLALLFHEPDRGASPWDAGMAERAQEIAQVWFESLEAPR